MPLFETVSSNISNYVKKYLLANFISRIGNLTILLLQLWCRIDWFIGVHTDARQYGWLDGKWCKRVNEVCGINMIFFPSEIKNPLHESSQLFTSLSINRMWSCTRNRIDKKLTIHFTYCTWLPHPIHLLDLFCLVS